MLTRATLRRDAVSVDIQTKEIVNQHSSIVYTVDTQNTLTLMQQTIFVTNIFLPYLGINNLVYGRALVNRPTMLFPVWEIEQATPLVGVVIDLETTCAFKNNLCW